MVTVSYVVGVHNEERVLEATVRRITERLQEFPGSQVVLVENGSVDSSPALAQHLAAELSTPTVRVTATTSEQGFGYALRKGIEVSTCDLVVLTAADLPFGFSDFDQVVVTFSERERERELVFGSKAHPDSRYPSSISRRVLSAGFRMARRSLLGLAVGDSQGTVLVSGPWARRMCPLLCCGDFLVTTELAVLAAREGLRIREVPVVADRVGRRPSSVQPVRDSIRMFRGLVQLRSRWADDTPAVGARTLARS